MSDGSASSSATVAPVTVSPPSGEPIAAGSDAAAEAEEDRIESRNLLMMAGQYVTLRVAWIFKTESVMMPAFLDSIAGAGWIRGFMPWLNRIGQSVPPLIYAERLRNQPLKKWSLFATGLSMSVPFLVLAALLFLSGSVTGTERFMAWVPEAIPAAITGWFPVLFLLLYFVFFSCVGLSQLCYGTVQGKLIRANRRGRLLFYSGLIGSLVAVSAAWLVLPAWLARPDGGFGLIFLFVGVVLGLASVWCTFLTERPDPPPEQAASEEESPKPRRRFRSLADSWSLIRTDLRFRRLVFVGLCFVGGLFLFPHYQALGRQQAGYTATDLLGWVIAQNIGAGLASIVAGPIADRFGNRLTLRMLIALTACPPLFAIALTELSPERAANIFWMTFFLLGAVPITFRTLVNYTLELCEPVDHPRYLSTLKISFAVPFCLSPPVGWLVGEIGFGPVFLTFAAISLAGAWYAGQLSEPRFEN